MFTGINIKNTLADDTHPGAVERMTGWKKRGGFKFLTVTLLAFALSCGLGGGVVHAEAVATDEAVAAVKSGDINAVKKLVSSGLSVDAKDTRLNPLLALAVDEGREEMVDFLLSQGASLQATNRLGALPVHFAAIRGNVKLVALFLEKGNDINAVIENGMTPLGLAVSNGHIEVVKYLLEKGADPNIRRPQYNYPREGLPLSYAIVNEQREMVELLLQHGADINATDNTGAPAYFDACTLESSSMLELMLSKGADPDRVSREGSTPLMWAASAGSLENVKLLASKRVKLDRTTRIIFSMNESKALTARELALRNGHKSVAEFLEKADPNSVKVRVHIIK